MADVNTRLLGRGVSVRLSGQWLAYWFVLLRVVLGWWMLHAGLDKVLTWPFDASWFLGGAAQGTSLAPFVAPFADGVLLTFVNVAIPIGQVLIGLGVLLGALTRLASFFGAFMMAFFYFINGETGGWAHGLVTGELLGILLFAMFASVGVGRVLGVDGYLVETSFVRDHPRTRYIFG